MFVSVLEPGIIYFSSMKDLVNGIMKMQLKNISSSSGLNKNSPQYKKAAEAALTALEFAVKCSNAMKEKMLLPGHNAIRKMASANVRDGPIYVASDLISTAFCIYSLFKYA